MSFVLWYHVSILRKVEEQTLVVREESKKFIGFYERCSGIFQESPNVNKVNVKYKQLLSTAQDSQTALT